MAIPTSRTRESGTITIDQELCNGCGLCVEVCKDFDLAIVDGKAVVTGEGLFDCICCAHCMMICPKESIKVSGRTLSYDDVRVMPGKGEAATYDALMALWHRRRSIREYKDKAVPSEVLEKVIAAARTAPMGIPPSDVHLLVLDSREKTNRFAREYCEYLESIRWMVSRFGLVMMRILYGKQTFEMFRDFIRPLIEKYTSFMKEGENIVTYDAPAAIYFYSTAYTDPADPIIPATYAMTAAESLGLGTCMLGGIHPFIQSGTAARKFREKWGIRHKSKEGLFVILGYPKVKYKSTIERSFAAVDWA